MEQMFTITDVRINMIVSVILGIIIGYGIHTFLRTRK